MKVERIILHCSATPEGRDIKASTIKEWHTKLNGWRDIGYHYVIDLDGTVEKGRPDDVVGAHCSGHNLGSLGICYVGGCDKDMQPKDTRTEAQKASLVKLVKQLMEKYGLTKMNIYCHNQFSQKACPSFNIEDFRKEL